MWFLRNTRVQKRLPSESRLLKATMNFPRSHLGTEAAMTSENSPPAARGAAGQSLVDDRLATASRQERQLHHALARIEEALQGLRFGQVTVTVQDGVVVQIDRLERTRLQRND